MNNSTNGSIATGKVDIEIKEFTVNSDNEEVLYTLDNNKISLGQEITLIPRIYNLGADTYIRAKVVLENSDTDISDWVNGISSDWVKVGDYYYYSSSVEKDSYVQFFETIKFPESDEENGNNNEFKVQVIAEAIQSKNFEQDLTLEEPWKNVAIEKMVDSSYSVDEDEQFAMEVKFENNADEYITISNNFFENIGGLLPGDTITENVKIKNSSKKTAKYFVSMEKEDLTDSEQELLKNIYLKIKNDDGLVIFNSSLYDFDKYSFGTFEKSEQKDYVFEISLPETLDNSYVGIRVNPVWIFSAEFEKTVDNTNTNTNPSTNTNTNSSANTNSNKNNNTNISNGTNNTSNSTNTNIKNEIKENGGAFSKINTITQAEKEESQKQNGSKKPNPKTGDRIDVSLILFFSSAIGLITVIILSYKEKKKFK